MQLSAPHRIGRVQASGNGCSRSALINPTTRVVAGCSTSTGQASAAPVGATMERLRVVRRRNTTGNATTTAAAANPSSTQQVDNDELGEIDPITGQVIARTSTLNPVAGFSVTTASGLRWAYRRSDADGAAAAAAAAEGGAADVLLIHGLGSSSWSYRRSLELLGSAGFNAVAPDWPGHGDSDKPPPSSPSFDYSEAAYVRALGEFVEAAGLGKQGGRPLSLVVQGSVLSQYALLWAADNPGLVDRLVILNTPLAASSKLRPELVRARPSPPPGGLCV